jgi:hypothetical protein
VGTSRTTDNDGPVTTTDDLGALAARFTRWHIWRGRSPSGRETDWHATSRTREDGKRRRLAAPDANGLRVLLEQDEALRREAAETVAA